MSNRKQTLLTANTPPRGLHDLAKPRHVIPPPTRWINTGLQKTGHDILYTVTFEVNILLIGLFH